MSMYEHFVLVFIFLNTKVLGCFGLNVTSSVTTKWDLTTVREVFVLFKKRMFVSLDSNL